MRFADVRSASGERNLPETRRTKAGMLSRALQLSKNTRRFQTSTERAEQKQKEEKTKNVSFATPAPKIGEMVIAAEADDSIECDVCKVTHVTDAAVTLHCWVTQGKNPKTATYKPVFIDKHGNVLLHKPRKSDRAEPFTWEIRTEDISTLLKVRGARVL